jgi:hypothetical protein
MVPNLRHPGNDLKIRNGLCFLWQQTEVLEVGHSKCTETRIPLLSRFGRDEHKEYNTDGAASGVEVSSFTVGLAVVVSSGIYDKIDMDFVVVCCRGVCSARILKVF